MASAGVDVAALRASEARLRAVLDSANEGYWEQDLATGTAFLSKRANEIFGLPAEDTVGPPIDWSARTHPDDLGEVARIFQRSLAGEEDRFDCAFRIPHADGAWRWIRLRGKVTIRDESRRPIRYSGTVTDIHEGMAASLALRESETRHRRLFDSMMDGVVVVDMEGRIRDFNEVFRRILGYPAEELRKMTYVQLTPERWHAMEARIVADQILPTGSSEVYEKEYRRADGSILPVELRTFLLHEGGEPSAMWAIVRDITERRRAENALRERENLLSESQRLAHIGSWSMEVESGIVRWSDESYRIWGVDRDSFAITVASFFEHLHPDSRKRVEGWVQDGISGKRPGPLEFRIVRPDGTVRVLEGRADLVEATAFRPRRIVGTMQDVTETRALQVQLALSARLAAIGTLVSGVAHEINNPLASEMADQGVALELTREVQERLRGSASPDGAVEARELDAVVEALRDAQEGCARIARIVKDLAAFGRPDPGRRRVRLVDVVDGAMRWLPASIGRPVSIRVENGGAPDILASAGQVQQVLVNLVTNAARATADGEHGTVVVRLGPGAPGMARLEVSDHGVGIAPDMVDRIFDPFFTTRPAGAGRGAGLGLAICHAIVADHGGTITVESEVGNGSTFRVELPAAPEEA